MEPADLAALLTSDDFEREAARRLAPDAYDYFRSGADGERTLARNRAAFAKVTLWPRVLVDVGRVDTALDLLGSPLALPILVAPMAYHKLAHPDGEPASARAAAAVGAVFVLPTLSTTAIEEVVSDGPRWFQLYVHRDRALSRDLVARAEAAGHRAIVVTVDMPVYGRRLADERNRFRLPEGLTTANLVGARVADPAGSSAWFASRHDPTLAWADLAWLRSLTKLPVLLKGILRADDAVRAVDAGVDGIIVSNHGGRQLDGTPASLEALPAVVAAVGGRVPVLVDGGIRSGGDVLAALALGARAVLVGRPFLWGLAVGGEAGARRVLEILRDELARAMALAGCPTLASITRDLVGVS